MLTLKLLGATVVERDGVPIAGRAARGHRLALLALLARGRPLSRDRILSLLFPESDTERGRRALSDTLYLLRGSLGEDVVIATGDDIRLNPGRVTSDVAEFLRLLAEDRLDAAVAACGGPFLEGFHLPDSAEFGEWADGERSELEGQHGRALERLAEAREREGDWTGAVTHWRRLAVREPANGRIALRLMLALDAAGDRAGAIQHARVHEAILREEYDAEPDSELVQLTERLRHRSLRGGAPVVKPAVEPPAEPVALPDCCADPSGSAAMARPGEPSSAAIAWTPAPAGRRPGVRRFTARPVAAALMALSAIVLVRTRSGAESPQMIAAAAHAAAPERSIAVLPFANLGGDGGNDYFSDGLTEELIGALGRVAGLRVAARASSFAVGGKGLDVRTIGDTLGVGAVLEGSVRREGNQLRVSARLADTRTGYQIWSEEYERELADIFAVQDAIARAIASALEVTLAGGSIDRPTPALEAHDLYLRGIFVRNKLTSEGLGRAVDYFDRAIQLDSSHALAYAGKATALAPLVWYGHLPREQGLPAIRAATRRALALDESLGEAHVAQGMIHFYFDWDWPSAEREFRRAIALNPSDSHAHHMYANYLVAMGRLDEGIAERVRALAIDPLSHRSGMLLGRDYALAGQYEKAVEQYRRAMEIDSLSPLALGTGQEASFGVADVRAAQGQPGEAFEEYLRLARLEGIPAGELRRFRAGFEEGGLKGYWRSRLDYELRLAGARPEALRIASILARIGDAAQAADWVERAYRERAMAMPFLAVMPAFTEVREDARFRQLIRRMELRPVPASVAIQ